MKEEDFNKFEELVAKERTKTMPNPIEDNLNINITRIDNMRATQIIYQPLDIIQEDLIIEKLPEDTKNYDKSIKIILLGDSNVGKTSIVHCLSNDKYDNYQKKALGLEHYNYVIKINNIIIRMQIWDTAGQEKFDSITTNYYKNTDVAVFVYSINDMNSFNKIDQWENQINEKGNAINDQVEVNKNMIKVLIGNKKDLENDRQVSYEQGQKLSDNKKFKIFREISCNLEGENAKDNFESIKNLFDDIGKKVYLDIINDRARLNSSSYCYQASNSILNSNESVANKNKVNNNSSCCC